MEWYKTQPEKSFQLFLFYNYNLKNGYTDQLFVYRYHRSVENPFLIVFVKCADNKMVNANIYYLYEGR